MTNVVKSSNWFAISLTTIFCCSIAVATESVDALRSEIEMIICYMFSDISPEIAWTASISFAMDCVKLVALFARFLTSPATTAKPRPASPARAASTAAFNARRLIWYAMAEAVVVEISIVRSLNFCSCVMPLASFVTEKPCLNCHNLANSWHAATKHHRGDFRV